MIKASKVVFISSELEEDFNLLSADDPIKKRDDSRHSRFERECFLGNPNS